MTTTESETSGAERNDSDVPQGKGRVVAALCAASLATGAIPKKDSKELGYAVRSFADVAAKAQGALAKNGLVVIPDGISVVESRDVEVGSQNNRKIWRHYLFEYHWKIWHVTGEWLPLVTLGEARDGGDKGANKCQTAAHKYAMVAALTLAEHANDPDDHQAPEREYAERPAGPQPITVEQWDQIKAVSARLDEASKADIKAWSEQNGIRVHPQSLSHGQAVAVLAKLDQVLAATAEPQRPCDECGHVGPLMSFGDGSDRMVCQDDAACYERIQARDGVSA